MLKKFLLQPIRKKFFLLVYIDDEAKKFFTFFSQPSMNKRAKTTHAAHRSLPDSAFPLLFSYLDLKDHSRFARSCKYALTQSGLTEESPRRCVWAKHMKFSLDNDLERFTKFTNVCKPISLRLSLYNARLDIADVAALATMPLKRLHLRDCRLATFQLRDEIDLGFLLGLRQLQELKLEGVGFSGAHFELLKGKNLTELSIPGSGPSFITNENMNCTRAMIATLADAFPNLRVLRIPYLLRQLNVSADVMNGLLDTWSSFTQLEVLDVSYTPITSLAFVGKLSKLKRLLISGCEGLTDDSLGDIVHLQYLCEVIFDNIDNLTKECVKHLGCLSLKTVTFEQSSSDDEWWEDLLLSRGPRPVVEKFTILGSANPITKALSCLRSLPSLRELKIVDCEINDLSPLVVLRLKSLHLKLMSSGDWKTLQGIVCGNVFINRCRFAFHVTVELRTTDGGDVAVHITEIGEQDPFCYVERTVRSSQLLH